MTTPSSHRIDPANAGTPSPAVERQLTTAPSRPGAAQRVIGATSSVTGVARSAVGDDAPSPTGAAARSLTGAIPSAAAQSIASQPESTTPSWLQLQSAELIQQLQQWSDQLDAREAELNARVARQENRERRFRLKCQDTLADQAEQQRAVERLRNEVAARARRLAFRDR